MISIVPTHTSFRVVHAKWRLYSCSGISQDQIYMDFGRIQSLKKGPTNTLHFAQQSTKPKLSLGTHSTVLCTRLQMNATEIYFLMQTQLEMKRWMLMLTLTPSRFYIIWRSIQHCKLVHPALTHFWFWPLISSRTKGGGRKIVLWLWHKLVRWNGLR